MFNNYGYNPYFNQQRPMQPMQPIEPYGMQPKGLQGKVIDSLDVVRSMDIPLDYSVSYFPLADGTTIASKQLMPDGTSKVQIYSLAEQSKTNPNDEIFNNLNSLKEDIEEIKKLLKKGKKDNEQS